MIVFQSEHNILMHPFHQLSVIGVFCGALFAAIHGSLVTSSLVRETTENESNNFSYKFRQGVGWALPTFLCRWALLSV